MILGFFIIVLLIILSGIFSGSEIAFFSLSEVDLIEIEKSNFRNRKALLKLLGKKDKLLTTILIGNNIVNFTLGTINAVIAQGFAQRMGYPENITLSVFTVGLTITVLLFGEILPKSVALVHCKRLSLFFSPVFTGLNFILTPLSFVFHKISILTKRMISSKQERTSQISESTVINVVSKGEELGVINKTEKNLIQNVFLFDQREVTSVMTHRTAVFALEGDLTLSETLEKLLEQRFSRIPIYHETVDNIIGVINLKEILDTLIHGNHEQKLSELVQKPVFIHPTKLIASLLDQFKQDRNHMAIVVDEFGGFQGVVTMEDILEELVGEIFDEKDRIRYAVEKIGAYKWLIQGRTDIITINREISGEISVGEEFDTLQGLIMSELGRLPIVSDTLELENYKYTVLRMQGNEILQVMVEFTPDEEDQREE